MSTTHSTELIGVLAHPAGKSPFLEGLSWRAASNRKDQAYLLFDFQAHEIGEPVEALRRLGAAGAYMTGRLRESAGSQVDFLSDEAHGAGTTNAITFDGDTATGHNTETRALIDLLTPHKEKFLQRTAVILGGGVMARAAAYAVVRHFRARHVTIAARDTQHAQLIKEHIGGSKSDTEIEACELFPPDIADQLAEARLLINATSIGEDPTVEKNPITIPDILNERQVIVDVVFKHPKTDMIASAEKAGATAIDGRQILDRQLDIAFDLFTEAAGEPLRQA